MALIFAFSAQPDLPRVPQSLVDLLVKKAAHTAEYAILAVLILRTSVPATGGLTRNPLLITWSLAVLYAVSDEIHQSVVPGRTAAALDVLIDGLGAALGLTVLHVVRRRRPAAWEPPSAPAATRRR